MANPERALADFVTRLKNAGTELPVEALQAGVRAAANQAAVDAARNRQSLGVALTRTQKGVRLRFTGAGAARARAITRAELVRRLPEIRAGVVRDIKGRMR